MTDNFFSSFEPEDPPPTPKRRKVKKKGAGKKKVVIADFIGEPLDCERKILGDIAEVVALRAEVESELKGRIEDADAIMVYHFVQIGEETIKQLKKCKLIVRCGVGVDNVDGEAAREADIPVANVPDYGTEEVADSAIGMSLALSRGFHLLNSRLRRKAGAWTYAQVAPLHRLRGRVFGIVGAGRIGTATALRAKAFGFRVLYHDPYVPDGRDKSLGIERVESLDELLAQSDILSLHCPLNDETKHLINGDTLSKMKAGAFLINTARGGVADGNAVLSAVERGHLGGAALDVLETEPPGDKDPLVKAWRDPKRPLHDRVIVNPHAAFYSEEGINDMRVKGCENVRRVLEGEEPRNVTN